MAAAAGLLLLLLGLFALPQRFQGQLNPTPTPTMTPSPTATSAPTVTMTIFRDEESLTLYIPQTSLPLDLSNFAYQVTTSSGTTSYALKKYNAFLGLPLAYINTLNQDVCLRLEYSNTQNPVQGDCLGDSVFLTVQPVPASDIFWYDTAANTGLIVGVSEGVQAVSYCAPGSTRCSVEWVSNLGQPTSTPQPTQEIQAQPTYTPTILVVMASATPGYPCEGHIKLTTGALLDQVRILPQSNAGGLAPVREGSNVGIVAFQRNDRKSWYQIKYEDNKYIGWILTSYVIPSATCPIEQ
jgi:hypothetical protein